MQNEFNVQTIFLSLTRRLTLSELCSALVNLYLVRHALSLWPNKMNRLTYDSNRGFGVSGRQLSLFRTPIRKLACASRTNSSVHQTFTSLSSVSILSFIHIACGRIELFITKKGNTCLQSQKYLKYNVQTVSFTKEVPRVRG